MKRINKKTVSIAIILVVIIVGIIIGLIVYNLGRQEDMSIQREEQNVNTQNLLTGSIENNTENICILTNKCVGLFCYCKYFKEKSGEHITKI